MSMLTISLHFHEQRQNALNFHVVLQIQIIAEGVYKAINISFEPMTRVYSVQDLVQDTLKIIKVKQNNI